ncbi:MAG TPA: vitamin K epoxide reductase family protein [Pyrinomonadaceae bacterium]
MLQGLSELVTGMSPDEVRREFRENDSRDLRRRRAIIGLSLLGLGISAAASLLQTGIVKHLPDPPVGNFDADKVMTSDDAYQFGVPDATIALAGFAGNVPLAAWGGSERSKQIPIIPVVAAGKSALEALAAGWYFYQMPTKLKTWCGYCIVSAGVYFTIFALTLPEAKKALAELTRTE